MGPPTTFSPDPGGSVSPALPRRVNSQAVRAEHFSTTIRLRVEGVLSGRGEITFSEPYGKNRAGVLMGSDRRTGQLRGEGIFSGTLSWDATGGIIELQGSEVRCRRARGHRPGWFRSLPVEARGFGAPSASADSRA